MQSEVDVGSQIIHRFQVLSRANLRDLQKRACEICLRWRWGAEADLRKKASLATNQEGPLPSPFPSPPLLFPPLASPFSSPPLPIFLPSLSFLFSPLPSPFPSRPLPLEVGPLFAARGSGGALKLPQRVRAEPGRQTHFGAF